MAVTIRDVAKCAGVSLITVSRVINGLGYIRDVTRLECARRSRSCTTSPTRWPAACAPINRPPSQARRVAFVGGRCGLLNSRDRLSGDELGEFSPFMATAVQPAYEIGRRGVSRLLARIAGEHLPAEDLVLPNRLLMRTLASPSRDAQTMLTPV